MGDGVFVTGATGMVGANLVRALVADGAHVKALVRARSHPYLDGLDIELVPGDLSDSASLEAGMSGCRRVFHIAALVSYRDADAEALHRVNVLGTRNVLSAARAAGVGRVVHTSSTAAVGLSDRAEPLDEDAPFDPRFEPIPYMWTKHLAELEVARAVDAGLDVVMVNPSTIFGGGDINRNTGRLLARLRRGGRQWAPPGGNAVVGIADVVAGHRLAMEKGRTGRRYILSTENLLYTDLFTRAAAAMGTRIDVRTLPRWTQRPVTALSRLLASQPQAVLTPQIVFFSYRFRYFDATRARRELGWNPAQSLEDAVQEACTFYDQSGD